MHRESIGFGQLATGTGESPKAAVTRRGLAFSTLAMFRAGALATYSTSRSAPKRRRRSALQAANETL